jgi:AcrR family transcriptional regulator
MNDTVTVVNSTMDPRRDQPRQRLLEAARQVFAEVGFRAATVREICARADHNVAAVNYYFGDKFGLYTATLKDEQLHDWIFADQELLAHPPKEVLRSFLLNIFRSFGSSDRPAYYTKVMMHELASPSEGLNAVLDQVIRPRVKALESLVGLLIDLPPTHPKTRLCVLSITGQITHYVNTRASIKSLWPEWKLDSTDLEEIANHIADFSIAALEAIKQNILRD